VPGRLPVECALRGTGGSCGRRHLAAARYTTSHLTTSTMADQHNRDASDSHTEADFAAVGPAPRASSAY
jgi:hypothetical protein